MIRADVHCNGELLMSRLYADPGLTLQRLVAYVEGEGLNEAGECQLRVRRATHAGRPADRVAS